MDIENSAGKKDFTVKSVAFLLFIFFIFFIGYYAGNQGAQQQHLPGEYRPGDDQR